MTRRGKPRQRLNDVERFINETPGDWVGAPVQIAKLLPGRLAIFPAVLQGSLSSGSSVSAKLYRYNDITGHTNGDSDFKNLQAFSDQKTVYDWFLPTGQTLPTDTKVIAAHLSDSRWYVISWLRPAMRCHALVDGAFATTDGTFTVDNVEPIDGGESPVASAATELTVTNRYGWEGDDNAKCGIEKDNSGNWSAYQLEC